MNKQIAGSTEKKSSFFRRSSLNATPVSTQRASTANSATSASSTKTHRHEVSFGLPMENASAAKDEPVATKASPCATSRPAADDDCPTSLVVTSLPDSEEFPPPPPPPPPPQVPTICTSYSHGLSTISERHSMEDDSLLRPIEGEGSRTNSSCSMPDYLCHKLHSVKVNVQPAAVSGGESQPHSKPTRNALDPRLSIAPSTLAGSSSISRLVKESCDSSTSTTTSESYQLSDLPPLPAKLATLSKPSAQSVLASALRSRKARHSIDVRALPSYLARKRQSTFGQFLTALSPTAPEESSSSDGSSLFSEPVAPTLSLGERVAWVKSSGPEFGVVKWIGRMPQITNDWTVGVEFDNAIGSGDGTVEGRRYFVAKENFAKFLPLSDLTKVDNYAGRPRSGTMLSRMSVQLKPGQLISIQRSPTTNVPHCYLNAPHHVGHDVHSPNNRHCQCPSCNHPCAHICKTRKPKGKRWTEDMAHMCHFSSKPHAHMCCGGEDLPSAAQPIIEPGVSWRHSEVIASLRTVPTEYNPRRKSINMHQADGGLKKSPRQPEVASPSFMRENIAPSNCSSALLERTGSDLSISSLPSSSSVAEVYIGRSVLTDESDIDSETERSLESNSKVGNSKQGLRSLVACFIANSLRLKKPEKEKKETTKSGRSHGGKRVKKSTRSEKDRFRSKQPRPLGLSSTDGSSYADIPSSALNSQPLPSLSLDASRHANIEPISRPAVLFSSPRFASSSNHVRNTYTKSSSKSSPYRKVDTFGQHHIDGHISEEVITNTSSNSSAPRMSSADRADSSNRPSTNASSENAASPRRRRNKGPAPKPPITAQCSSSPLSTTNNTNTSCPSSVPQSPTNSSVVTSLSASSKNQVVLTKSPAPLPPHLTRSLSEQKQLNMKNLINATHTFRSEVNLQDLTTTQSEGENSLPDELLHLRDNEENIVLVCEESFPTELLAKKSEQKQHHHRHHHHHHQKAPTDSKRIAQMLIRDAEDAIYQTPLPVKTLLTEEMPPDLPSKTFDPVKVFGCKLNGETKRLERTADSECSGSPSMPRSLSMPCSQFTCCMYHWKEYLNVLSKTDHLKLNHKEDSPKQPASNCKQAKSGVTCEHDKFAPLISEECDCESDHYHECAVPSDLMNALLSPQHSLRYRKHSSKDSSKKHSPEHASSTNADLSVAFGSFERCEFIRALSDGSLTNTSTATVVEFINDDSSNGDSQTKREVPEQFSSKGSNTLKQGNAGGGGDLLLLNSPKCLSDVFCQTNFEETPERPVRRYRNHKYSCRCRHLKARSHGQNRHCRHRHCAHHDCCPSAPAAACFGGGEDMRATSRNVWLTSSTSDHSLSSLSSSTSTLSEASTMRTSSTLSSEVANCKVPHLCTFGEPILSRFPDTDVGFYSNAETLTEMMLSGRSPISTERLFKSAENNFPPPLVEPESTTEFDAFDQLHLKSSSTPSGNVFQELNADMFLNTTTSSIPCKPNNSNDKSLVEESQNKCLMSELEMAIACGNHQRAAILAKELAIKRANCSLSAKFSNSSIKDKPVRTSPIVAYLYIEDRNTHKGPIPFQVYPSMSVNMLKLKVEKEFNIPSELQKWVLGRNIATNLSAALSTYGITNSGCPIFLYVLSAAQPATSNNTISATLNNKPSLVSEMTKTNGNLSSDDDNIYESLRAPPAVLMPLTQYDEKCGQSLNSSSNTLSRKTPTGKSLLSKEAGNGSGQLNSLASFGGSSSSTGNVAYFAGDSNVMAGTNNAQLVCSDAAEFAPTTSLPNTQHLVKNYYYQEGEVPFGNQLVFEGLGIVNELLPRLDEEDEDDLEEEEDEITAKNVNGISELALATLNEVTTAAVSTYQKLVELEDVKCVRNVEPFECPICFGRFKPGEGVVLRECLHTFCRDCLKGTIEYNEEVQVKCPFRDDLYSCDCALQDREIKELASSETYERYLKKSVSVAEKNLDKSFHCKNADCAGKG